MNTCFETIETINCSICLDANTNVKKNACHTIKCYTCSDGFICSTCIGRVDPSGSIYKETLKDVEKAIKCPCCRTLNWNYHYNQIVGIVLAHELYYEWDEGYTDDFNNAIKLFLRNKRDL